MEQFEGVTHRSMTPVAEFPKALAGAAYEIPLLIEPLLVEDVPGDGVAHFTLSPDDHRCAAEEVEGVMRIAHGAAASPPRKGSK
jgi:hypothetical protein